MKQDVINSGPVPKGYRAGTHRLVEPARTVERLKPLMPALGITRIANITGLDYLRIPVYAAYRPNARSIVVSQGKGLDDNAARASALMESIELYHAERITLPVRFACTLDLLGEYRIVDIKSLPRLSVSVYSRDLRMLWIEGLDLLRDREIWLPYELIHMNLTLPLPPGSGCFHISSNGLASGNHILEAISHGICELVERDSYTLWSLSGAGKQNRTRVDLESIDDPACCEVLDTFQSEDIITGVWDLTSDIGLPVFRCSITERRPQAFRESYVTSGMGCHACREIGLLRALTEAAQSRVTLISGARDDLPRSLYSQARCPETLKMWRCNLRSQEPVRRFQDAPTYPRDSFDEDVRVQLELLEAANIDSVIVVDLTHHGLQIPVVRVVVPGLETSCDFPGYTPGTRAKSALRKMSQDRK